MSRPPLTRALLALFCGLPVSAALAAGEDPGPLVASVRVEADAPVDAGATLEQLHLRQGQPLDRRLLREGVRAVYAAGQVDWLRIDASQETGGLTVTVTLRLKPLVSSLDVTGVGGLWRRRVKGWVAIERGVPASEAQAVSGARRAQRELRQRGWPHAVVEPFFDYDRPTNAVAVTVEVTLGPEERLAAVVVEGVEAEAASLAAKAAARPGARLTRKVVDRCRRRAEAALRRDGYWEAEVVRSETRGEPGATDLVLRVDPGPRYRLQVEGDETTRKLVKKALPDPVREELHPAQTQVLAEELQEKLQGEGYLLARVDAELVGEEAASTLRIAADLHRVRRVAEVVLEGATSVTRHDLDKVIAVHAGRIGGWRGQTVTTTSLESDRLALEGLYRRRGFAEVTVATPVLEPVGDEARVVFRVEEGRRYVQSEVRRDGFPLDTLPQVEKASAALQVAGPWDRQLVEEIRRRLEVTLADAGYPDAKVLAEVDSSRPDDVRVVLRAEPGPFVRIGTVVIASLRRTRPSVVERALGRAHVVEGEPFGRQALLDARRSLYELGIFRRVDIEPLPGEELSTDRGLVVRSEEGDQRSYLFGLGWDSESSARLTLGWSHLNLFGGAHALSVETRLSRREERYQIGLREPFVFGLPVPAYAVVYRTQEDLASYSQRRRGLWFEIGDRRRRPLRPWLRYEYQLVRPDAPPEVLSELEREEQQIQIASLTPTLEWDTRDDLLRPGHGLLANVSAEYAFPLFQANAHFLKLQAGASAYARFGGGTGAAGVRLGTIYPADHQPGVAPNLEIPLAVRFFAGGSSSQRAFGTDDLGIEGQTLIDGRPIGGNAVVLVNLEYQHPLRGVVSGVVFLDGGNVWAEPRLLRWDDVRWGAGLGLRLDTPAGPVRLEYGWKLDRMEGESPGKLFLSFGVPF